MATYQEKNSPVALNVCDAKAMLSIQTSGGLTAEQELKAMGVFTPEKNSPVALNVCDAKDCFEEKAWGDTLCVRCQTLQSEMDEAGIGQRLDDHRGWSYTRLGKNGQVKTVDCQDVQKARSNRISAQYADMAAEREAMSDAEKLFELLNLANSSVIGG